MAFAKFQRRMLSPQMYTHTHIQVYIYIYVYTHEHMNMCIYIYQEISLEKKLRQHTADGKARALGDIAAPGCWGSDFCPPDLKLQLLQIVDQ